MAIETNFGYGRHIYVFGPEGAQIKSRMWLRTLYIFEPMYHTSTTFAKYSMFVQPVGGSVSEMID